MGMGEKVRSAAGSMGRSGSRGYQAPGTGVNDGVVLGRGEKVKSGGGGAATFPGDSRYHEYDEDDGHGDDGYSYSEGSVGDEYERRNPAPAKGYGGIEAYKAKSWRRFF